MPEFEVVAARLHRYSVNRRNISSSGVYTAYIGDDHQPTQVYCDMTTDGGGWLVCWTTSVFNVFAGLRPTVSHACMFSFACSVDGHINVHWLKSVLLSIFLSISGQSISPKVVSYVIQSISESVGNFLLFPKWSRPLHGPLTENSKIVGTEVFWQTLQ